MIMCRSIAVVALSAALLALVGSGNGGGVSVSTMALALIQQPQVQYALSSWKALCNYETTENTALCGYKDVVLERLDLSAEQVEAVVWRSKQASLSFRKDPVSFTTVHYAAASAFAKDVLYWSKYFAGYMKSDTMLRWKAHKASWSKSCETASHSWTKLVDTASSIVHDTCYWSKYFAEYMKADAMIRWKEHKASWSNRFETTTESWTNLTDAASRIVRNTCYWSKFFAQYMKADVMLHWKGFSASVELQLYWPKQIAVAARMEATDCLARAQKQLTQSFVSVTDVLKAIPSTYQRFVSSSRQTLAALRTPSPSTAESLSNNSEVTVEALVSVNRLVLVDLDVCNGSMDDPTVATSLAEEETMPADQASPSTAASKATTALAVQLEPAVSSVSWRSRIGGYWFKAPSRPEDDLDVKRKEFYALAERRRQEFEAARVASEVALLASYVHARPMMIKDSVAQSPTIRPVSFAHHLAEVCQLVKDLFWFCTYIAIAVAIGNTALFLSKGCSVPTKESAPRRVVKAAARNTRPAAAKNAGPTVPFVPKRGSTKSAWTRSIAPF